MGGRRKKPTKLRELEQNQLRPCLRNKTEPKPREGEPVCPASIKSDPIAWDKWCELIVLLDDMGILTIADADVLATYCRVFSQMTAAHDDIRKNGMTIASESQYGICLKRNPSCLDYWQAENTLRQLMPELGLTPSGRARLHASKKSEDEDPLIGLLRVS